MVFKNGVKNIQAVGYNGAHRLIYKPLNTSKNIFLIVCTNLVFGFCTEYRVLAKLLYRFLFNEKLSFVIFITFGFFKLKNSSFDA